MEERLSILAAGGDLELLAISLSTIHQPLFTIHILTNNNL
jgi:hypothetical protein